MLRALGSALRAAGRAVDELGIAVQGKAAYRETCERFWATPRHASQLGPFHLPAAALPPVEWWGCSRGPACNAAPLAMCCLQ